MPDANGNIKGIALNIDEATWRRIFGKPQPRTGCATPPGQPCHCTGRCRRD